jgi:C-terminal processing protease CtpA/Prc
MNPYRKELREIFDRYKQNNITNLIVDLRYNRGGYVSICQYLCGLVLPDEYLEQISGYHEFNEQLSQENYETTGNREDVLHFPSKATLFGQNIGLPQLFVILTGKSFSASESLVNSLDPYIQVIKIGTTSGGKGVGSWSIADNRYPYQLQPITFRYYNKNHITVPDSGLPPDIYVDETNQSSLYELGDIRECLLNATLLNITGGLKIKSTPQSEKVTFTPVENKDSFSRRVKGYMDNRENK